jgi:hypothetical protein
VRFSGKVSTPGWQPHPDAKVEVIDQEEDGSLQVTKSTNPDGTVRFRFNPTSQAVERKMIHNDAEKASVTATDEEDRDVAIEGGTMEMLRLFLTKALAEDPMATTKMVWKS